MDFNPVNYAYDVYLSSNQELLIAKYQVVDKNTVDQNGKRQVMRSYTFMEIERPDDIEARIKELLHGGYFPINRFKGVSFDADYKNVVVYVKLMLLAKDHRLLEKYYQVRSGDENNLDVYISYINMNTGKISSLKVCSYPNNEEVIHTLKSNGYICGDQSFYENFKFEDKKKR